MSAQLRDYHNHAERAVRGASQRNAGGPWPGDVARMAWEEPADARQLKAMFAKGAPNSPINDLARLKSWRREWYSAWNPQNTADVLVTKEAESKGREAMIDPHHLREQARKCRTLAKTAIEPELIETGKLFVRHKANLPSGGQVSDIDIGVFLSRDREHPEHQALLQLIGTLVERHPQHTGPRSRSTKLFYQSRSQRAESLPDPCPKRKR